MHVQNGARRQLRAPGESSLLGREFLLGRESLLGPADGRPAVAVPLLQRAVADSGRYLGPDHPLTRAVRDQLESVAHG